jgi:hypothetical protein
MEQIVRNVRDIAADDRPALEHVIGQRLRENQQIIIQVMTVAEAAPAEAAEPTPRAAAAGLPVWCNVYEGLSDQEIQEIERVILDRDHWTRDSA